MILSRVSRLADFPADCLPEANLLMYGMSRRCTRLTPLSKGADRPLACRGIFRRMQIPPLGFAESAPFDKGVSNQARDSLPLERH